MKYFAFRKKNGKDNTELLTAYLTACPADSLQNDDNLKLLYHNLTYCNTKSFDIVFKKRDKLIAWYGNEAYNTFSTVIHNSRTKAIRDTNRVLFQKVCAVMSDFQSRYSEQYNSKFAMDFYKITNEIKLYSDAAEMYLNKYVMKINADSVKQRDYQMFARAKRRNPELDSTLLNYVSTIYSKELFDAANVYYEKIEDKDLLIHAMHWAKKAVEFNETYQTLNFYAHLLYKIDVKIDAKVQATKAIEVAKKNKQKYTEAEELLKKL